jgi:hypothetical protein
MTSPIIDALFIAPRSRRAVHEAVLDSRHERPVATTRAGRLACRLRAIAAIARATFRSLPAEFRQLSAGDLSLRVLLALVAAAILVLARGIHPDVVAVIVRTPTFVNIVMVGRWLVIAVAVTWPLAFLWRARRPLPPVPIALLTFAVMWAADEWLLSLTIVGFRGGAYQIQPTRSTMPLTVALTLPALAASLAFVACVIVNQVRGWRRLAWVAALPLSLAAWRWMVELFQQEATRLACGRPEGMAICS